jgi:hypothetical protein
VWPADLKCHLKTKHGQQKSKEKRCSPTDRGIYTAAATDRGIYDAAADLLLLVKHVLWKKRRKKRKKKVKKKKKFNAASILSQSQAWINAEWHSIGWSNAPFDSLVI